MPSRDLLVAVCVCTLLLVALTLWVYPSGTDFAPSNPYWNGLQRAREELGIKRLSSLNLLAQQAKGTALIVIPTTVPSSADLDTLKQYTEAGGVLILMDDFGFGNTILADLGVNARLSGLVLVDPLFNFRNRRFPRITAFSASPLSEGVDSLVLNYATVITDASGLTVLARSSPISFLGKGKGDRDAGQASRPPFAVAGMRRLGEGYLILVSDPSILLSSMLDLGGNRRFLQNLFKLAGDGATVYLDEAHLPQAPLDVAKEQLRRFRGSFTSPLAAFATAGVGLAVPLAILWRLSRR